MGDFHTRAIMLGLLFLIALQIHTTSVAAESACPYLVQYNDSFQPACDYDDLKIKWPNYENPKVHYACLGVNRTALVPCPPDQYFIFVLQACGPCDQYIPPVTCSKLPTKNPPVCRDSKGNPSQSHTSLPTPRYPTESTKPSTPKGTNATKPKPTQPPKSTELGTVKPTLKPTLKPTKAPSTSPGSGNKPTMPTTLIPPPPSPPATNPNVPLPPTPPPTPPLVDMQPPYQTKPPLYKSN